MKRKLLLTLILGLFLSSNAYALDLSRVKSWSAGEILTAADLNAEFNNITNHAITNNDVSATAGIVASKLNQAVAGAIGATTPSTGAFTTLSATGNSTFGDGADTVTFNSSLGITYTPVTTWTFTAAQTVSGTWADLGVITTADINGGTIDGVTITTGGKLTAGANEIEGSNFDITGGTMSGVQIGGTTATGELIVNDASDDADGLGSQGTSGQYLQSQGAGANPTWATIIGVSQVNDTDTGTTYDNSPTVTFLTKDKTITSGNTVLLIASGYIAFADSSGANRAISAIRLYYSTTVAQTVFIQNDNNNETLKAGWSCCAIVTGLSGATTFSVTVESDQESTETIYGNLIVLEF